MFSIAKGISVTGVTRNGVAKKPISPGKYGVVTKIFNERLETLQVGETEKGLRTKRLNILIKTAISNISKKRETDEHGLAIDTPEEKAGGGDEKK